MINRISLFQGVVVRLGLVCALFVAIMLTVVPNPAEAAKDKKDKKGHHQIVTGPTTPSRITTTPPRVLDPAQPLKAKKKSGTGPLNTNFAAALAPVAAASTNHTLDARDMKILLISAVGGSDPDYQAMSAFLNQLGTPFDTLIASTTVLSSNMLWDGVAHGYYQGVILTDGDLLYESPVGSGNYVSAFTADEWQTLSNYETMFGVRQVTSYTIPGLPESYGLSDPNFASQDTSVTPLKANLTAAGKTVFPYINAANPITIQYAWTYLAKVESPQPGTVVTPLLNTTNGYTVAAVKKYADGRENLAITAENNSFLIHSQLLSYGIINWVTKGLFLGERHATLNIQPDDLFIEDDIWDTQVMTDTTGISYRLTGNDFKQFMSWQNSSRVKYPLASGLKIEWPFNADGTNPNNYNYVDTLTPEVLKDKASFNYINHTFTHANLDNIDAATLTTELQKNNNYATNKGLTPYYKDSMIQPDISGLFNPVFANTAYQQGIRYIISDASRPEWSNPSPNAGFYSQYQSGLLIIPRHASNLFYNLTTPAEWVSEYNCYYGPQGVCPDFPNSTRWNTNLNYQQILDDESNFWLSYLLKWDIDPLMFHQPNARAYDGIHSLLGDLVEATLKKYTSLYNLPIQNLTQHEVGIKMANRMAYNASGLQGTLYPGQKIVLTTTKAASVPVTYAKSISGAGFQNELYGGQYISTIPMAAGQTRTITLP